jgi:hypothetical protein
MYCYIPIQPCILKVTCCKIFNSSNLEPRGRVNDLVEKIYAFDAHSPTCHTHLGTYRLSLFCKDIYTVFNTCFLILQKSHVLEVKTDSHITSEHSCHTFEHLKTVEIKKCRRSYDIRVKEILKLLGDWGIPSSKISIHYKKSKGQS